MKRGVPDLKAERTVDNAQEAMETPFLVTASELHERQTRRRSSIIQSAPNNSVAAC